jgi:catechol 2,3-dioxygenase-like lactoylglutathione lyase family enzyme
MTAPTLDLIQIATADLVRSVGFYRSLGLDVPQVSGDEPHVDVELPNGLRLAWDPISTIHSFDPTYRAGAGRHPFGMALSCGSPAEVDALYERMVGEDPAWGHLAPFDASWGHRWAALHDPDGVGVDLYAPLA